MTAPAYVLIPQAPELEDYLRLRSVSGLSPKTPAQAAGALTGSWTFCHVRTVDTSLIVAMGRVIGDGGWYFHIADMATDPDHQRRGLGRQVLDRLLQEIRRAAPPSAYVTLIADEPGRPLYRSAGFTDTAPDGLGMYLLLGTQTEDV